MLKGTDQLQDKQEEFENYREGSFREIKKDQDSWDAREIPDSRYAPELRK